VSGVSASPISDMCRAPEQLRVLPLLAADAAPQKKNFPLPPLQRLNHNVALLLLMRIVSGLHTSLWSGTVLASYLYVLMGSNAYAGYVEAAMGIANLVFALPAGYLADRFSRSGVIAVGGWCVPLAAGLTCTAVIIGVQRKQQEAARLLHAANATSDGPELSPQLELPFWLFVAALAMWGFVQAVQNGAAQALFADSVLAGERSRFYMYSFVAFLVASTLGPIVSIIMFVVHGNDWELPTLRNVFLAGMAVSLPNWLIMCFFSDKKMLDEAPPADSPLPAASDRTALPDSGHVAEDGRAHRLSRAGTASLDRDDVLESDSHPRELSGSRSNHSQLIQARHRYAWAVRYIMFASSTMLGFGSGMTIKFFPLFFKNYCQMCASPQRSDDACPALSLSRSASRASAAHPTVVLAEPRRSPVAVQVVYAALPLVMAISTSTSTALSRRIGRVQVVLLNRVCGIVLLCALAFLADFWLLESVQGGRVPTHKVLVVAGIYLTRTALMNGVQPLNSSIMMDFTPRHSRARWQSLTSIVRFGWCGSAALGGVLSDRFGYSFTFLITAGIQLLGTSLQLLLLPLVPVEERLEASGDAAAEPRHRACLNQDALQPLDAAALQTGRAASTPAGRADERLVLRESISSECE
jgi:MFS family permease